MAEPRILGDLPIIDGVTKAFAELRANTLVALGDRPHALVAVTSPNHTEPRRHVAAHLATAISQTSRRVLLVDADIDGEPTSDRHQNLSKSDAHVVSDSLSVVTSQAVAMNDSGLLSSQASLSELRDQTAQYDILILATPSVLNVPDTRVLASIADGTLIVVTHGKSDREDSVRASLILRHTNTNLLGAVVVKD